MKNTRKIRKGWKSLLGGGLVLLLVLALTGQAVAQNWTELSPTGGPPAARLGHVAVYNPANNRMVVFGGVDQVAVGAGFEFNDVWVLSNADGTGGASSWTQFFPTGTPPSPRAGLTENKVYDIANNRMIVFGGNPNIGYCFGTLNDTWVLSNADGTEATPPAWTQLSPTGGPPSKRGNHSAVYDSTTNRMITFGGNDACASADNQVWVLTNANGLGGTPNWTQLSPTGGPIPASSGHTAGYDPATNRMTMTSGSLGSNVWVLENANGLGGTPNWIQLSPTGGPPSTLGGHGVYDPTSNQMILFGGNVVATGSYSNEVWVLENANGLGGTPNWIQLSPTGGPPAGRGAHSVVLNVATNRMTVFAGHGASAFGLNDTWVLADVDGAVVENCSNGIDDDGDGDIDCFDSDCPGSPISYYADADGDSYGNPLDIIQDCVQPTDYVTNNTDCDDNDPAINPGAQEICNDGIDNDCDGDEDCDDSDCATDVNCVIESVDDVVNEIGLIDTSMLKNANMKNALLNKLNAVIADIKAGNYADALAKLQNDILKKTDGCANSEAPDKNDWVKDCDSQATIYQAILDTITMVEGLL